MLENKQHVADGSFVAGEKERNFLVQPSRVRVDMHNGIASLHQMPGVRIARQLISECAAHDGDDFILASIKGLTDGRLERFPPGVAPVEERKYQ